MLQRFFEEFYKVVWDKTHGSDPLYPTYAPTDGESVMGLFVQGSSSEAMVASAQGLKTRGRLAFASDAPVDDKDVLRRACDGFFFKLASEPKSSPRQAQTQIKVFQAVVADRPDGFVGGDAS